MRYFPWTLWIWPITSESVSSSVSYVFLLANTSPHTEGQQLNPFLEFDTEVLLQLLLVCLAREKYTILILGCSLIFEALHLFGSSRCFHVKGEQIQRTVSWNPGANLGLSFEFGCIPKLGTQRILPALSAPELSGTVQAPCQPWVMGGRERNRQMQSHCSSVFPLRFILDAWKENTRQTATKPDGSAPPHP